MSTRHRSTRPCHPHSLFPARLTALLTLSCFGAAVAGEDAGAWQLEPGFDLRMVTYIEHKDGASMTRPAVGANLGLELSSTASPFAVGLFADFELPMRDAQQEIRLLGGWARYSYGRWDVSSAAVHYASGPATSVWMYLNRFKFEPRPGHNLALEAIGALDSGSEPALQLVYETDLTPRISLCVSVGLGSNRLQDLGASTTFVWNLR